jgi:type III pantothenate kinase
MRLIVDVGNSRAKVVVLDNRGTTLEERITESITSEDVAQLIERHPDIRKAIVATTRGNGAELKALLKEHIDYVLHFDPATTPIPIGNLYHTPKTLGADRLAAAVGVAAMYPATDIMVIDFGTAITIDYVVGGAFVGGNISPGVTTRFRALADYTAKLPLCLPTDEVLTYGRTTSEAIEQGVMQGITNEIEGYIEAFLHKKTKKYIIFTGGDAKYFVKRIKNTIFADCEPVICGLNRILNYNADKI